MSHTGVEAGLQGARLHHTPAGEEPRVDPTGSRPFPLPTPPCSLELDACTPRRPRLAQLKLRPSEKSLTAKCLASWLPVPCPPLEPNKGLLPPQAPAFHGSALVARAGPVAPQRAAQLGRPDGKAVDRAAPGAFQRWARHGPNPIAPSHPKRPKTQRRALAISSHTPRRPLSPAAGPGPRGDAQASPQRACSTWGGGAFLPSPAPAQVPTHLQHELTLVPPHEDELSGQPVAGAAAAHQEPGSDAHLGAGEAAGPWGEGVVRAGPPSPGPPDTPEAGPDPASPGFWHLHGTSAVATSRNDGIQASPSPRGPVPPGPLLGSWSDLILWAHMRPPLSSGCQGLGAWGTGHTVCMEAHMCPRDPLEQVGLTVAQQGPHKARSMSQTQTLKQRVCFPQLDALGQGRRAGRRWLGTRALSQQHAYHQEGQMPLGGHCGGSTPAPGCSESQAAP